MRLAGSRSHEAAWGPFWGLSSYDTLLVPRYFRLLYPTRPILWELWATGGFDLFFLLPTLSL